MPFKLPESSILQLIITAPTIKGCKENIYTYQNQRDHWITCFLLLFLQTECSYTNTYG